MDFETTDGSASAPSDYDAVSGTLNFAEGETTKPVTVQVHRDNVLESTENFFVDLDNASPGTTIADARGQGTIQNDDAPPLVTISDVSQPEGTTGQGATPFQFTISLSNPAPPAGTSVQLATANDTASAPSDYITRSQTVNFASGETSKQVSISVVKDSAVEPDETFFVNLSSPTNAGFLDSQGRGTIENDDVEQPEILIDNIEREEGDSGTTPFTFTVSLTHPFPHAAVGVTYHTVDGSAREPLDYTGVGGVAGDFVFGERLIFQPGETEKQATIEVNGDEAAEGTESFFVDLSSPTNATIARARGNALVLDDDRDPGIAIHDASNVEGTGGTRTMVFFPSAPAGAEFDYETVDGTAQAGTDYVAESGHITMPTGQASGPIIFIDIVGDSRFEPDETFFIRVSNPSGAPIADGEAQGTILNNDRGVSIGNVSKDEGDSGTKRFAFTASLDQPAHTNLRVDYDTVDAKAKAPGDYNAKSGRIVFDEGVQSMQVPIQVRGDHAEEPDETFSVKLSNPSGLLTIADDRGTGTIRDDDALPEISVTGPGRMPEGDSGTTEFPFVVSLNRPAPAGGVGVDFEAVEMDRGETADRVSDFQPTSGHLTFAAGVREKTVSVPVNGDTGFEQDEPFQLRISDPARATIGDRTGGATVDNDDVRVPPPHLVSMESVSAPEDTGDFTVTMTLDRPAPPGGVSATIRSSDSDFSATDSGPERDFFEVSSSVSFGEGVQERTFEPTVLADSRFEPDERFRLVLSQPNRGLVLEDGLAVVTIENDDPPPPHLVSMESVSAPEDTGDFTVTMTLDRPAPPGGVSATIRSSDSDFSATDSGPERDFFEVSSSVSFGEGVQERTFEPTVLADSRFEPDERFRLVLSQPNRGLVLEDGLAVVTIENDDPEPPPKRLRVERVGRGSVSGPGDRLRVGLQQPVRGWHPGRAPADPAAGPVVPGLDRMRARPG